MYPLLCIMESKREFIPVFLHEIKKEKKKEKEIKRPLVSLFSLPTVMTFLTLPLILCWQHYILSEVCLISYYVNFWLFSVFFHDLYKFQIVYSSFIFLFVVLMRGFYFETLQPDFCHKQDAENDKRRITANR